MAFAHPSENAVRVYFYGLTAPPEGQEYVVAARTKGGEAKALGDVVPGNDGTGFLLARDLPEGTTAIELLLRPQGQEALDGAEPRVSARYPANGERGVLTETAPAAQAPARSFHARVGAGASTRAFLRPLGAGPHDAACAAPAALPGPRAGRRGHGAREPLVGQA